MMRSRYWLVVSTVPCLFSFAAGAEMVVEKPGDERRLGHPVGQAALFNLVQGLSPATKSALLKISWNGKDFGDAQQNVPPELCEELDKIDKDAYREISRYLLQERVAGRHWVCMAVAEFVSVTNGVPSVEQIDWGRGRFVPIAVAIEDLNDLYPSPRTPPCEIAEGDEPGLDGAVTLATPEDPFRELFEWSVKCTVDHRDVEYRYNHVQGWYRAGTGSTAPSRE